MAEQRGVGRAVVVIGAFAAAFAFGVGVGRYEWPPYRALASVKATLTGWAAREAPPETSVEPLDELLAAAFTEPLIESELLFPPIASLEDIVAFHERIDMRSATLESAYDEVEILGARRLSLDDGETRVMRVGFTLGDDEYHAYAYVSGDADCGQRSALVIPGTGANQGHAIIRRDSENYHGPVVEALHAGGAASVLVQVKPNEDFRAIHDGTAKLNDEFIINHHLNRGGSYSLTYVVEALALIKWMQDCHREVVVAGLSQGGKAALLAAILASPDKAIIASGYSVLSHEAVEWSGFGQVVIPGSNAFLEPEALTSALANGATQWLFTFGAEEPALFGIEASDGPTCRILEAYPAATCVVHDGGHTFPDDDIIDFIAEGE